MGKIKMRDNKMITRHKALRKEKMSSSIGKEGKREGEKGQTHLSGGKGESV